jgi:tetratricopeptide (TPR) repeat protein
VVHGGGPQIYKKLEEYLRSFQNYKLAIENNPNYAEAYYNLGILYSSTKNYKEAINNANKAINLDNNYIDAYKLRADTNSLYSKNYQAIKDYNKLKKLDKKNKIEYDNKIFLEKILLCDWSNYNSDIKEFKKFLKNTNQIVSPFRLLSLTDSLENIKNNTKNYIK